MSNNIGKDQHTFYSMMTLFRIGKDYAKYLIAREGISKSLKMDLTVISNKIAFVERTCLNSLANEERAAWQREWTEKDYEVYGSILFALNDMNEEKRAMVEHFVTELAKDNVKMELDE